METYLTINNDRSIFYFAGEDADADICHQYKKSLHQQNHSKIMQIGAGRRGDTVNAPSCVELAVL